MEPAAVALSAPLSLTLEPAATAVTLRWTRSAGDTSPTSAEPSTIFLGYHVYRQDITNGPGGPIPGLNSAVPLKATVFHDLGVVTGHTYTYQVRTVDTLNRETSGAMATTTAVDGVTPATPLNVRAVAGPNAAQVTITWSPNSESDLAGYRLYRFDVVNGTPQWVARPAVIGRTATAVADSGLAERATYTYALTAYDAGGRESALSASSFARPHVSTPAAPAITISQILVGWYGASVWLRYQGSAGDASGYREFRVYQKEETLPSDQWQMVLTDPVTHIQSDPLYGGLPHDVFKGEYVDPWVERCRVVQFLVSGITNDGEETVDSAGWRTKRILVPVMPIVTWSKQGNQTNVKFDAQGFIGCSMVGNGFTVTHWTLVEKKTGVTTAVEYNGGSSITLPAPPSGETWAYVLKAEVEDLYETTNANFPALSTTYISEDVCVRSDGTVNPSDGACDDLDKSREIPPPIGPSNGGVAFVGGPTRLDDGTWQFDLMRMDIARKNRGAFEVPRGDVEEEFSEPRGLKVARSRDVIPEGERVAKPPSLMATTASRVSPLMVPGALSPRREADSFQAWNELAEFDSSPSDATATATSLEAGGLNVRPFLITGATPKTFAWQFFSWDHLGSVRVVTNESGAKVSESKYLPYGDEMPNALSTATDNTHRFTGHERDGEDGLDYMKARYYGAGIAAMLSPDPVPGNVGSPGSFNAYSYVRRNPVNLTDALGLAPASRNPTVLNGCTGCGGSWTAHNSTGGDNGDGHRNPTGYRNLDSSPPGTKSGDVSSGGTAPPAGDPGTPAPSPHDPSHLQPEAAKWVHETLDTLRKEMTPALTQTLTTYGFDPDKLIQTVEVTSTWLPMKNDVTGLYSPIGNSFNFDPSLIGHDDWFKHNVIHEMGHYAWWHSPSMWLTNPIEPEVMSQINAMVSDSALERDSSPWGLQAPFAYALELYQFGTIHQ